MSILDDAIREHLELKRAHGADESELKKLEDEAFGLPTRPDDPDPFAEAPTEFLATSAGAAGAAAAEPESGGRRMPNIADLQEAPPPPKEPEATPAPEGAAEAPEAPAEEEHPAVEQEAPPQPDGVHTTEEREAIASQPTEMFDVQAEIESPAEGTSSSEAAPSDEELVDAGLSGPRLAPVDPISGIEASTPLEGEAEAREGDDDEAEDDDYFSEQRLSDELNQALEAPITDEHAAAPIPHPAFEPPSEEHEVPEEPITDEREALPAETDEHEALPPQTEEGTAIYDAETDEEPSDEHEAEEEDETPAGEEDVLEGTPEFLEDSEDDVWFEQRPPKDFDFDD